MILLAAEFLCGLDDILSGQAESLQQSAGGTGVAELVVDTDAANNSGALLSQHGANSLTQATDDGVLFRQYVFFLLKTCIGSMHLCK